MTISPINVIPVILPLFTDTPLANAASILAGFAAGVAGMLVGLVAVAGAANLSPGSGHSSWGAVLELVLGAYLLLAGIRKFQGRPRRGEKGSMPKWMEGIAAISLYVLVSLIGVAAPILVTIFLGDRAGDVLDGWNG